MVPCILVEKHLADRLLAGKLIGTAWASCHLVDNQLVKRYFWCNDTQHNDIQHNGTQRKEPYFVTLSIALSIECYYAEYHNGEFYLLCT